MAIVHQSTVHKTDRACSGFVDVALVWLRILRHFNEQASSRWRSNWTDPMLFILWNTSDQLVMDTLRYVFDKIE